MNCHVVAHPPLFNKDMKHRSENKKNNSEIESWYKGRDSQWGFLRFHEAKRMIKIIHFYVTGITWKKTSHLPDNEKLDFACSLWILNITLFKMSLKMAWWSWPFLAIFTSFRQRVLNTCKDKGNCSNCKAELLDFFLYYPTWIFYFLYW